MKRLELQPEGWPCTFGECPPGLFLMGEDVCLRTQYGSDAYLDNGDAFWGGASTKEDRNALIVQPLKAVWMEVEF